MNVIQSLTIFLSHLGPEHQLVISLQITGVKTEQINGKRKIAVTAKTHTQKKTLTDLLLNLCYLILRICHRNCSIQTCSFKILKFFFPSFCRVSALILYSYRDEYKILFQYLKHHLWDASTNEQQHFVKRNFKKL